jgi:hypothetical protein
MSEETTEISLDEYGGWYPNSPLGLQNQGETSNLLVQMGQYNANSREARLYNDMQVDLYYSLSSDQTGPEITVTDGLYDPDSGQISVKVGAADPSGIQQVVVVYSDRSASTDKSLALQFDADMHKWTGAFPGSAETRYWVQVIDGAGNKTESTNKGLHFTPGVKQAENNSTSKYTVYLPLLVK